MPDLTFLLDADPRVLQERMTTRRAGDRIEREGLAFQEKVRGGFLRLAKMYPERIVVVDALRAAEEIREEIRNKVKEKFWHG